MRAIVQTEYGVPDVLELRDVEKPAIGDDEVLVRVHAASINPYDWHSIRGVPYFLRLATGLRRPKNPIPAIDLAGRVEAVGEGVTRLRPEDEVFGLAKGALAEYACAAVDRLLPKPSALTFEQAAAVPLAGLTALQALRDTGQVEAGQKVLIVGASGGVGTFAVQIAKSFGAQVTGVCSSKNVDLVRSIGADSVIDYTREDFTRSRRRFDLIVDMVGTQSLSACRRAMTPQGTYVVVGAPTGRWVRGPDRFLKAQALSRFVSQRLVPFMTRGGLEDLSALKDLLEAGEVTPVLDRTYRLDQAAEAVRYLEGGHVAGKVVLTVSGAE